MTTRRRSRLPSFPLLGHLTGHEDLLSLVVDYLHLEQLHRLICVCHELRLLTIRKRTLLRPHQTIGRERFWRKQNSFWFIKATPDGGCLLPSPSDGFICHYKEKGGCWSVHTMRRDLRIVGLRLAFDGTWLYTIINAMGLSFLVQVRFADGEVEKVGRFDDPFDGVIAEDMALWKGHVFVSADDRLVVFDIESMAQVRTIGEDGPLRTRLCRPRGIAVYEDEVYVADSKNHRVAVYACGTGKLVRALGGAGPPPRFRPDNNAYVPASDGLLGAVPGQLSYPRGVTVVARGGTRAPLLVVSEPHLLHVMTLHGEPIQILEVPGASELFGLSVSADGRHVFAADRGPSAPAHNTGPASVGLGGAHVLKVV
jgi:hypothetical protein